jgi:hypothetical protein
MKKVFTLPFRKVFMTLFLGVLSFGAFADELKPYPVYFPLADYPEFKYGATTYVIRDSMAAHMYWHSAASWTATANCASIGYKTLPSNSLVAAPYGRMLAINIGVNRATYFEMQTPYLNPGTYRVYLGTSFSSGTIRTFPLIDAKVDSVALIAPTDTTLRVFNYTATTTAPNKQSVVFSGTGTNRHYDIYCGKATITRAGIHKFQFETGGGTGTEYAFSMLQLIPVTDTDLDTDYDYPKFDNGGNVYNSAADSTITTNNTATTGYYQPYQVEDPNTYTKVDVTIDAGLYFADKLIVIKRADDKWTRLFSGTADATGKALTSLPVGSYYVEVNNGQHTSNIEVTAAGSFFVGVETGNVNVTYSPELWYVGKTLQIYNSTGQILLKSLTIPENGVVSTFALPVDITNKYIYYVVNSDGTTHFDEGTFSVPSTATVNLDFTATKYNVSIGLGNDLYGSSQLFTIVRSTNSDALYASTTSSAAGTATVQLPNGTYYLATSSGLVFSTFTVDNAAVSLNLTKRYTANFCLGKTVAGKQVDVFLSSNKAKLYSLTVGTDGKVACSGLTNGRFYHNVYSVNGTDTTWITKKFTFVIDGADLDLGDCGNLEKPYYLPYPVYFDVCNQPEITWLSGSGTAYAPGSFQKIKFDKVPVDTIYSVRDTTWTTDTTYVLNYDSTSISSITYWDWNCYYNFIGPTYGKADDCYIWGDQLTMRMPAKSSVTFVTPNLNPGRYNVYMSNRWGIFANRASIDTSYMDGVPLITDGTLRKFAGTTDDYTGGMSSAGLLRILNYAAGTSASQAGLFMGEALVTTSGCHDFKLYTKNGSATGTVYSSSMWWNMIYFIPVDRDAATPATIFWPRLDYCGNLVYKNAADGNTTATTALGTDGVNRSTYFGQFKDSSVYYSDVVDYTKTFTVNGGMYSKGDNLTTISPIDNWTIKQSTADATTGIATQKLVANADPYTWRMDTEHVTGSTVITDNTTITIPEEIEMAMTSTFSITPDEEDPSIGAYSFNSTVRFVNSYPFYYPITGAVTYSLDGVLLKTAGDTIYEAKKSADNGKAPTYSTSLGISDAYTFLAYYSGSGTRLSSAMNVSEFTHVKGVTISAGIWPNPASEYLNIKVAGSDGAVTYRMYNQLGQTVLTGSFSGTQTSVGLNGIPSGIYMLTLYANGEEVNAKVIVK